MLGITDRTFVITGGAQGIGLAAAQALVSAGGAVALADIHLGKAREAAASLRSQGARAEAFLWDVRDHAAAAPAMDAIEASLGPVRGLVASAGIVNAGRSETLPPETWKNGLALNLDGVFYACQAAGVRMLANGGGAIVNLTSVSGFQGHAGRAAYTTSKWGVIGLTKTLALEWGHRGIRVNAVGPNAVESPLMQASINNDFLDEVILDRTPLARVGKLQEIAQAILFLLSDHASYINGIAIPVDGGLTSGYMTRHHGDDTGSAGVRLAGQDRPR